MSGDTAIAALAAAKPFMAGVEPVRAHIEGWRCGARFRLAHVRGIGASGVRALDQA